MKDFLLWIWHECCACYYRYALRNMRKNDPLNPDFGYVLLQLQHSIDWLDKFWENAIDFEA